MQVDTESKSPRASPCRTWQPYEKSHTENAVLLPFLPRRFYQLRWALMNRNPLCWRVPGGRFTWGELVITAGIAVQMLWLVVQWAADPGLRTDVLMSALSQPA
jgi:hypothetical protein